MQNLGRLERLLAVVALLCVGLAAVAERAVAEAPRPVVVLAAASLQNAMKDVVAAFARAGGTPVTLSFAGSAALARQIEEGAAADVFLSADAQRMDEVARRGLIQPATRTDLLTDHLALIAAKIAPLKLKIAPWFPLLQALGGEKLAMAADTEPAGVYGKAALVNLQVWSQVEGQVVRAETVRGALNLVARGEAPLGVVYDTDAMVEPLVRIVDLFPDASHPPIVYPAALLKTAVPGAAEFLRFVEGREARDIFERYGFRRLP